MEQTKQEIEDLLEHKRAILNTYTQRLRLLKLKAAQRDINTSLEIALEIADLQKKIRDCKDEIAHLQLERIVRIAMDGLGNLWVDLWNQGTQPWDSKGDKNEPSPPYISIIATTAGTIIGFVIQILKPFNLFYISYKWLPWVILGLLVVSLILAWLDAQGLVHIISSRDGSRYTYHQSHRRPAKILLLLMPFFLVCGLFFVYGEVYHPYLFPPTAPADKLGVVISTFGQYDYTGYSHAGKQFSVHLAEDLENWLLDSPFADRAIVHHVNVLVGDEQMAGVLARRSNSKIVFWGRLYEDGSLRLYYDALGLDQINFKVTLQEIQPYPTPFPGSDYAHVSANLASRSEVILSFASGLLYFVAQRYEEAGEAFEAAIRALEEATDQKGIEVLYIYLGRAYVASNRFGAARTEFQQALALLEDRDDIRAREARARAHAGLGIIAYFENDLPKAEEEFLKAWDANNEEPQALLGLALIRTQQDRWDEAESLYRGVIEIQPQWALPHYYLGSHAYEDAEYEKAREEFGLAISKAPNWALAHYSLGLTYLNVHDCDAARENINRAGLLAESGSALQVRIRDAEALVKTLCAATLIDITQTITETVTLPQEVLTPSSGDVVIFGTWRGADLSRFQNAIDPFTVEGGIRVEFESPPGFDTEPVAAMVDNPSVFPPDLVVLSSPRQMYELVALGRLVPLDSFMDAEQLKEDYGESVVESASYEGRLYGILYKADVSSLIWYNPRAFASRGYEIPVTWDALFTLSDQIVADGDIPWCIGLESGSASGWPAADWIADMMLRTAGPEDYDKWVQHKIPWTDKSVVNAWERFGQIARNEKYVYGGTDGLVSINFGESPAPLFSDPPGCYLHRQASFITEIFPATAVVGEDYDFSPVPPIEIKWGTPLVGGASLIVMTNDTPEARQLMKYLASSRPQAIWAAEGGFISLNKQVELDIYPDELSRKIAGTAVSAETFRFTASELMPAGVGFDSFWQGTLDYVGGENLSTVLGEIETSAAATYPR